MRKDRLILTRTFCPLVTLLAVLAVLGETTAVAAAGLAVQVQPPAFQIGTFFHGANLRVEGSLPATAEVVVRFVGIPADITLKKKGKVFGILWMNRGTIHFHHLPNVFLVYYAAGTQLPQLAALGFQGLEQEVSLEPASEDKHTLFQELLKLKTKEGLYRQVAAEINYGSEQAGSRSFQLDVAVPPRLTAGLYHLEVYALDHGKILATKSLPIRAELVGAPALITKLAFNHALLYGILATMVAIAAGLLMGLIFGGGKGGH